MQLFAVLSIALLNIIYLIGFFSFSIWRNVAEAEYFLGYNPRLIKFKIRQVTFNIGFYIPIVGLSPIYTLVDGQQRMKYPWEFSQHSLARRLLATFGGAISLLIAGVLISIAQYYFTAESSITKEEVNKHGIYPSALARESGFLPGDKIIAVNGKDYQEFDQLITAEIMTAPEVTYTVLRDGQEIQVTIRDIAQKVMARGPSFFTLQVPFEISEVAPGSPADLAGIKPGDRITKVNKQPVISFGEMMDAVHDDDDKQVTLQVERPAGESLESFSVDVPMNDGAWIGIRPQQLINYTVKKHSLGEALIKGPSRAFISFAVNVRALVKVISGNVSPQKSLSGPIGVQQMSKVTFWWLTGFYAIWYAFWNLLPLPKSAFWEVLALAYERLTKKKYPYKAFQKSTSLSWIPLGILAVWIFVGDILKLFF